MLNHFSDTKATKSAIILFKSFPIYFVLQQQKNIMIQNFGRQNFSYLNLFFYSKNELQV